MDQQRPRLGCRLCRFSQDWTQPKSWTPALNPLVVVKSLTLRPVMQDLSSNVRLALEAYLYWGQVAAQSLMHKQDDEFFAAMTERDVAFKVVHSLDDQAQRHGRVDPVLHELWLQIDQVNRTLLGLMVDWQGSLRQQLGGSPKLRLIKTA